MISFKGRESIYLLLSIISLIMLREFWLLSRNGIHVDESLSFMLSAYKDVGMTAIPIGEVTGSKLREMMWFSDTSFSGWASDIVKLWNDNRDTPHSNLYYSLLRTWFIFGGGTSKFFDMFWAGQLNILLSSVSMFCIWRIAKGITHSNIIAITAMLIAFMSTGSISNTIFLRPYQLQETAFCLYFMMMYFYIVEKRMTASFMLSFGIVTAITALTGYFSLILLALTSVILLGVYINRSIKAENKHIKEISIYISATLIFLFLIYPPYLFVFGSRQSEALSKATDAVSNFKDAFNSLVILKDYYFLPFLICATAALLSLFSIYKEKRKESLFVFSVIICSIVWFLVVMFFAPYKVSRYILPIVPLLSIAYASVIIFLSRGKVILSSALSIVMLSSSVYQYEQTTVQYQYGGLPKECRFHNGNVAFVITAAYRINAIAQCLQDDNKYSFSKTETDAIGLSPDVIFSDIEIKDSRYKLSRQKENYSYFYEYTVR